MIPQATHTGGILKVAGAKVVHVSAAVVVVSAYLIAVFKVRNLEEIVPSAISVSVLCERNFWNKNNKTVRLLVARLSYICG